MKLTLCLRTETHARTAAGAINALSRNEGFGNVSFSKEHELHIPDGQHAWFAKTVLAVWISRYIDSELEKAAV